MRIKKHTCRILLSLVIAGLVNIAPAQAQYLVSGKICDRDGEPLAGAAVSIRGLKGTGAVADAEGRYTLTIPDDDSHTIVASFIGFMTQSRIVRPDGIPAQDFTLSENPVTLEQVVVTGTRTPRTLMESPITTRVITDLDISKSDASNVQDLLQMELPGIEFSFSMDQQVNINFQGFGGNSVLFLIDGERVAGETLDNVDYNRLNLDNVERIEIVKGAASSLYGSNAVGGVVNLITKDSGKPWSANLSTRFGAHNAQQYNAAIGVSGGKVSNMLNAQYNGIDTYDVGGQGDFSTVYGSRILSFKDRLVYTPADNLKFTARAGYYERERDSDILVKDRYRSLSGGLKGEWDISDDADLEVSYSYDEYDKSDYMTAGKTDLLNYSNVQHNARVLFNYVFGKTGTLTAGGDFMNDYLMSYQFEDGGSRSQITADGFVQFDWNAFRNFSVIGAVRYDWFSERKLSSFAPKLGLMYKTEDEKAGHFTFRGSYAKGFRAPTLKEMYMSFDMASIFMIYGNPDLQPEVSHNFLLSAEYFKRHFNVTVSGFFNMVSDGISTVWNQELRGMHYTNMAPSNIAGADLTFSMRLPCGVGTKLAYTYTKEYTTDGSPSLSTARPHSLTARIEYGREWKNYGFDLALNGRFLSPFTTNVYSGSDYTTLARQHYPGYTIWKLVLSQSIWKGIRLNLTVDNLFNYRPKYYYNNSPATVGTTFAAGLAIAIEEMFEK